MSVNRPIAAAGEAAVAVRAGYCINLRGRIEACDLCVRACHAKAITLSLDEVTIDPQLCVGCGACVPACPGGALSHDRFDPEALVQTAVQDGVARLACAPTGAAAGASTLPCHRMLDARLMAALFAAGAARIEVAGLEHCAGCPNGDARPALKLAQRTLEKWFGAAGPEVIVAEAPPAQAEPEGKKALERRHLLRGAFGALAAAPEPEPDVEDIMPSFDDPRYFDDVEAALARPVAYQNLLAEARPSLPFSIDGPSGATGRVIGESCSGCMVCSDLCPTGALEGLVARTGREVSFDPALCTNCTLCIKVCPMAAMSAHALRGVDEALAGRGALYTRADQVCSNCGASFAARPDGSTICQGCQNDQDMDDNWLGMLQ